MRNEHLFIGIDGGGTKTKIRVETMAGDCLGEQITGPSQIRLSPNEAKRSIVNGITSLLRAIAQQGVNTDTTMSVYMGLAGTEQSDDRERFLAMLPPYDETILISDALLACGAAHAGQDGAIAIIGTGLITMQSVGGVVTRAGGLGFPHDDIGSGAWLGWRAIQMTLQSLDHRLSPDPLTDAVAMQYGESLTPLLAWVNQANATDFARLAPLVVQHASAGVARAEGLLIEAASDVERCLNALNAINHAPVDHLPLALLGGLAEWIQPHLTPSTQHRLVVSAFTPVEWACHVARQSYKERYR